MPDLHGEIYEAVQAGARLEQIEEAIIDPAGVDEEHKSALWLYAEALRAHHSDRFLDAGPALSRR